MIKQVVRRFLLFSASLGVLLYSLSGFADTNGIFADFTTSMGSFTCRLEYATAPKAVANFIGLATGQRAWLDLPTGRARTNAFYNGLTFHRVVAGFVIQAGSPSGNGKDGPGYFVPDEISPSLRFTNTGILAMANTGTNSNGSQFFITVTNAVYLNDHYTIFGELAGGTNVVLAINKVAVDTNDVPLTNVIIQSVGIRRVGTAAQAFDINGQGLPVVTNLPLSIARASALVGLSFSNRLYADNRLYYTTNLSTWTPALLGIEISSPFTNSVYGAADVPSRFFRMAQVQYPSSTFAPKAVLSRNIAVTSTNGFSITNNFDSVGGGTYFYKSGANTSQGTIQGYSWVQEPYRGDLLPIYYSGLVLMTFYLDFTNTSGGIFSGTAYTSPATNIGGTFLMY